jgi:ribonuclease-3 family protein
MTNTPLPKETAKNYSPLTLAFLGDCVYELLVRQKIVLNGSCPVRKLHNRAVEKVRASYQADGIRAIMPTLTDEEAAMVKRGRNANSNVPKSASVEDYRLATGLETLFGYLSLIGEHERIYEIFEVIYEGKIPKKVPDKVGSLTQGLLAAAGSEEN